MSHYFYIDNSGQQQGPIAAENLIQYGVTPTTMVWTEGMSDWAPASSVAELTTIFRQTPPPVSAANYNMTTNAQPAYQPNNMQQPYMPKPESNLVWAILSTLFCCLPTGIAAIIFASKVDSMWAQGYYDEAVRYSRKARNWSLIGAIAAVVVSLLYFLLIIMAVSFDDL
ncbi:MAG: CD225/dispanin family protein [Muribaculaceae bacterium]|nr:CD225/dispanin family protein [Muribaculaceae bacterium]